MSDPEDNSDEPKPFVFPELNNMRRKLAASADAAQRILDQHIANWVADMYADARKQAKNAVVANNLDAAFEWSRVAQALRDENDDY